MVIQFAYSIMEKHIIGNMKKVKNRDMGTSSLATIMNMMVNGIKAKNMEKEFSWRQRLEESKEDDMHRMKS